jgi:hypothetical protein
MAIKARDPSGERLSQSIQAQIKAGKLLEKNKIDWINPPKSRRLRRPVFEKKVLKFKVSSYFSMNVN